MEERIDFALEPGVIIFAISCFVMINALIAVVLYPYLKADGEEEETGAEPSNFGGESPQGEERSIEQRIDRFHEEISDAQ